MNKQKLQIKEALTAGGYNQTYIILNSDQGKSNIRHVMFRCGNWCYTGNIQFGNQDINANKLTLLITTLQKQQNNLRYYCDSLNIPEDSIYFKPMQFLTHATEFINSEITSDEIQKELNKLSKMFSWIDTDDQTYFELILSNLPEDMKSISLIASKTYVRGLILVNIYYEGTIFTSISSGEGNQGLLDVRFPQIGNHGQGILLSVYDKENPSLIETNQKYYRKLTLWQSLQLDETSKLEGNLRLERLNFQIQAEDMSSKSYIQTYCVLKEPQREGIQSQYRDCIFRFGNWFYGGRVKLSESSISLADIPITISKLRTQQSALDFLYEARSIPTTSPFYPCLSYFHKVLEPVVREIMSNSSYALDSLINRLVSLGLGGSVRMWLEGADPLESFFEFTLSSEDESMRVFQDVEMITSKCYDSSGACIISIFHENTVYIVLKDITDGSDIPLLDCSFPSVIDKGRGYVLHACQQGIEQLPALRKVTVWQNAAALQREFVALNARSMRGRIAGHSAPSGDSSSSQDPSLAKRNNSKDNENNNDEDGDKTADREDNRDHDKEEIKEEIKEENSKNSNERTPHAESKFDEKKDTPREEQVAVAPRHVPHHLPPLFTHAVKNAGDKLANVAWDNTGRPKQLDRNSIESK